MIVLLLFLKESCYSWYCFFFKQMNRLGLNMHTGNGIKVSKIEVYFPSRSLIQFSIINNEGNLFKFKPTSPMDLIKKTKKINVGNIKFVVDRRYTITPKTQTFTITEIRYISFTKDFKYLESWISYDLHDNFDINSRFKKTNQAMRTLKFL